MFKFIQLKAITVLTVIIGILVACSGGASSDTSYSAGNLAISGESNVALSGSQWLTVSLQNSNSITSPVKLSISSSDSKVLAIVQNDCSKGLISLDNTCNIYVKGSLIGNANITITANGYLPVNKTLNVTMGWGEIGGKLPYDIERLAVYNNKVYAFSNGNVYVSNDGMPWQLVGGGKVFEKTYFYLISMSADENHVCVTYDPNVSDPGSHGIVKCATSNTNWQEIGKIDEDTFVGGFSIYNGVLYISILHAQPVYQSILYCPIDNCIQWKQYGQKITDTILHGLIAGIYNQTAITNSEGAVYYQDNDGYWKVYGTYPKHNPIADSISINQLGVFMLPANPINDSNSYLSPRIVYYHNNSNLGSSFTPIGGSIQISSSIVSNYPTFALNLNTIFLALDDGNIYSSLYSNESWSNWKKVGKNKVPLSGVYVSNNKVYSRYNKQHGENYVYVYDLTQN
jgi:hypothetical protein